jgi:hypothetical protein
VARVRSIAATQPNEKPHCIAGFFTTVCRNAPNNASIYRVEGTAVRDPGGMILLASPMGLVPIIDEFQQVFENP